MNKEQIELRIAKINSEIAEVISTHSKLVGHLTEAQHWASVIIEKETKVLEDDKNHTKKARKK